MPLIQNWIHRIEEGGGLRFLKYALLILVLAALVVAYNLRGFKNMASAEAMDSAQLARNIADHKGYKTLCVRPFSLFLLKRAYAENYGPAPIGDRTDRGQLRGLHPDIANPPIYPLTLAGLMKVSPKFKYQPAATKGIWSRGGRFWMYQPDFLIGLFNQGIFLVAVLVVFLLARKLFDNLIAWTSAGVFLGTDLFWRFSISGLSTMLLILIFLVLAAALVFLEHSGREGKRGQGFQILFTAGIGVIVGIGCLTRYSFGWLIIPVIIFLVLFLGQNRIILCLTVIAVFALTISPWIYRNYHLSHTPFGVAGYAIYETTSAFPEFRLQRSLEPNLAQVRYFQIWYKFINNFQACLQDELPKLGGSWISAFFLVGLLIPFKNFSLNRLRYFVLLCLPVLMVTQSLGRTALSEDSVVITSENLLVLVAPLVIVFGVSLFYLLLDQMHLPAHQFRYLLIGAFCFVITLPTIINCVPFTPRTNAVAYPPYDPPSIQQMSGWMKENELIISDVPWAVAWYGNRQSIWTTLNAQADFFDVYDYQKPINALYLTPSTMDGRILTQWIRSREQSWGSFVIDTLVAKTVPPYFPLKRVPVGFLPEQLFIADSDRWTQAVGATNTPSH